MKARPFVHVTGPERAGKTTFVEQVLRASGRMLLAVHCALDDRLRRPRETAPRRHAEIERYREAGATHAVEYRFPRSHADFDAFYATRFMDEYSEGVVLEGDLPVEWVDLGVFVAPPLPAGATLLRCFRRDPAREHWAVADAYQGIERAQVVVVNVREPRDRPSAQRLLADLVRIRTDEVVARDVLRRRGSRVQITAVAANLADARDPGLKKALRRVERALARVDV